MNALQINNTKKAVNIVKEYIPSFFNSDSYKWDILEVIMNNKDWGMKERILCVLIWPLSALVFFITFMKQFFR